MIARLLFLALMLMAHLPLPRVGYEMAVREPAPIAARIGQR